MAKLAISAAILAGGKSSRFGSDKALYPFRGKPLIAWVLESLAEVDDCFIVGPTAYHLPLANYPDLEKYNYLGPLGGLYRALKEAKHDWLALVACDMPLLSKEYWALLDTACEEGVQVVMGGSGGGLEPLASLYHRSLLPLIESQLKAQKYSLLNLYEKANSKVIPWHLIQSQCPEHQFLNINYLADLASLG
ncbi:MAG: molybdenum cofactor guanylyltransferase [Deinococcales bacterium]